MSRSPPADCPIVWRRWTSNTSTKVWEGRFSSSAEENPIHQARNVLDGLTGVGDPTGRSSGPRQYPFLAIDLGRTFRVTRVDILGGDEVTLHPLNSLEVRVGAHNKAGTGLSEDLPLTENRR